MIELTMTLISAATVVILYLASRAYLIRKTQMQIEFVEEMSKVVVKGHIFFSRYSTDKQIVDQEKAVDELESVLLAKGIKLNREQIKLFVYYAYYEEVLKKHESK